MKRSPRVVWVEQQVHERYREARILDVGFVGSYDEPFLHNAIRAQNPSSRVVGVDIDITGVVKWRIPDTLVADAAALPFADGSFDAVLCLEVLEHVYPVEQLLQEFHRVLRVNGEVMITTPNAWSWWNVARHWLGGRLASKTQRHVYRSYLGAPDHVRFFEPLSLMNMLDDFGLQPQLVCTKNHAIPFLHRFFPSLGRLDLQFWPMNRMGGYICLIARKR